MEGMLSLFGHRVGGTSGVSRMGAHDIVEGGINIGLIYTPSKKESVDKD